MHAAGIAAKPETLTVGPVEHAPDAIARSRAFLLLVAAVALGAFTARQRHRT